ncbi:MAG TPA: hypothetical protein DD827_10815 [Gammaproteobacteria bacterium]|nr:hypothetical protein [Gammaproteobacteria bacterium]
MLGMIVLAVLPLHADDTEIYFTQSGSAGDPNILFILDASKSMLFKPKDIPFVSPTQFPPEEVQPDSRYAIMKNALIASINNIQKANIGLMNYGGHREPTQANGIKLPVSPLSPELIVEIEDQIDNFKVDGFTPIAQTLYEAALYFQGKGVDYGDSTEPQRRADIRSFVQKGDGEIIKTQDGFSMLGAAACGSNVDILELEKKVKEEYIGYVDGTIGNLKCIESLDGTCSAYLESGECAPDAFTADGNVIGGFWTYDFDVVKTTGTYISPIKNECQENVVVLLSDGQPDDGLGSPGNAPNDLDIINKIQALTSQSCGTPVGGLIDGSCGAELTQYLSTVDQSNIYENEQFIHTYVIGFAIEGAGRNYLESIAKPHQGNQGFYTADNEEGLVQALTSITADLVNINSSFSPPSITVERTNSQANAAEIFVPMFRASQLPRWNGNIKGYRLDTKASPPVLKDGDGNPVLGGTPKAIVTTARSFWLPVGDTPDGAEVAAGGTARLLNTSRNLFTHNNADKLIALTKANLEEKNWFGLQAEDAEITDEIKAEQVQLIQYIRGIDPVTGTESRQAMGDVLHSRPVTVDYGKVIGDKVSGDQEDDKSLTGKVIFVGTNEGYLHAFRASDGKELFAFMPQTLLRNIKTLKDNVGEDGATDHPYGMDGQITVWRNDADGNGSIDLAQKAEIDRNGDGVKNYLDKDFIWIFAGMRRGGKNYYALDVTQPESPALKWVMRGGEDDFKKLGQTWATPVLTQVDSAMIKSTNQENPLDVLVVSGGYDTHQDEQGTDTGQDDNQGNAIFMVDPNTGKRLWWASRSGADLSLESMANSMPATVRVLDIDSNGVADRLYAADTGGRIFRIDLPDTSSQRISQGKFKKTDTGIPPVGSLFVDIAVQDSEVHTRRFYYEPDIALVTERNRRYLTVAIGSGYRAHPLEKKVQDRLFVFKDYDVFDLPNEDEEFLQTKDLLKRSITSVNPGEPLEATPGTNIVTNAKNGWYVELGELKLEDGGEAKGEKALARAVTFDSKVFFTTFVPETAPAVDVCSSSSHTGRVYALDVSTGLSAINFKDKNGEPKLFSDGVFELKTTDILSEVYFNLSRTDAGAPVVDAFIGASFNQQLFEKTENRIEKIYWQEQINH